MSNPAATRRLLDRAESETAFQAKIVELATRTGWLVHAERTARTKDGWRTAIQGLPGWPDLVLVRGGVMILAELKSQRGKPSPEQQVWLAELARIPGLIVRVWRPSDWQEIESTLIDRRRMVSSGPCPAD